MIKNRIVIGLITAIAVLCGSVWLPMTSVLPMLAFPVGLLASGIARSFSDLNARRDRARSLLSAAAANDIFGLMIVFAVSFASLPLQSILDDHDHIGVRELHGGDLAAELKSIRSVTTTITIVVAVTLIALCCLCNRLLRRTRRASLGDRVPE